MFSSTLASLVLVSIMGAAPLPVPACSQTQCISQCNSIYGIACGPIRLRNCVAKFCGVPEETILYVECEESNWDSCEMEGFGSCETNLETCTEQCYNQF